MLGARAAPRQADEAGLAHHGAGVVLPLLAISLPPLAARVPVTLVAVTVALVITGWASARLGGAAARPAVVRNVVVGLLAMGVTFAIGSLVGGAV